MILESLSFNLNTPTFTLLATSRGGPPTTSTWARDGVPITNSNPTILSRCPHIQEACLHSVFESRLTVTGNLPGVYQYSVSNRANSTISTVSINIEGECFF